MATFNVNTFGSFVSGTAASDTFNMIVNGCTVLGLDGDDIFIVADGIRLSLSTAVPATIASISRPRALISYSVATAMTRCSSLPATETTCSAAPATTGSVSVAAPARH